MVSSYLDITADYIAVLSQVRAARTVEMIRQICRAFLQYRGVQIPGAKSPLQLNFFAVAPNICVSSLWILLYVVRMASRILRWLLGVWKICELCLYVFTRNINYFKLELRQYFLLNV